MAAAELLPVLVHHADGHGPLAHRGGHPSDGPAAHVPGGEHARAAGLERQRAAHEVPAVGVDRRGHRVRAGQDEAPLVHGELALQPARVRLGADEHEQRAGLQAPPPAGAAVLDDHGVERPLAGQLAQLGARQDLDGRRPLDLVDQVARHVAAEVLVADRQVDAVHVRGEEHGGLPGRVAAPHDHDGVAGAELRLHPGGRVVHAGPLELAEARDVEAPVAGAGRDQHRQRAHGRPVVEPQHVVPVEPLEGGRLRRDADARAEAPSLDDRPLGQLGARDARREAEVVLDARRGPRLAARRDPVEDDGGEPLRGAVDGRRQPGRPRADDQEVAVERRGGRRTQSDPPRQLGVAGVAQHRLTTPDHHRRVLRTDAQLPQQRLGLRVALEVEPAVREAVARGELAQPARVRVVARAHDPEAAAELDQEGAPDEVRLHDEVAQAGVPRDRVAQPLQRDDEHRARLAHDRREERGLPGEQVDLAEESPGPVHRQLTLAVVLDDRHQALEHHDEIGGRLSLPVEHLPRARAAPLPPCGEGGDLLVAEPREGPVEIGRLDGRHLPPVVAAGSVSSGPSD